MSKQVDLLQTLISKDLEMIRELTNNKTLLQKNRDVNEFRKEMFISLIDDVVKNKKQSVMTLRSVLNTKKL
jgi:flagellar biosynthesis regulator FlaF